ncbi:MAG TPA: hypothetical protein VFA34_08605, partial [Actinomycetota bacterium]|nr:hypothetical protein [Actinomycetota bacterium]
MHRALASLMAVLFVASCSSTTKRSDLAADKAADASERATAAAAAAQRSRGEARSQGAASGPSVSSGAGGSTLRPGTGPVVVPETRGVDATTIKLGARYVENDDAFTAAFGIGGVSAGDHKGMYDAVFRYVNEHGGIAGRKVAPFYYPYDVANITQSKAQQEAACTSWTEDSKVFAAVSSAPTGSTLAYCMQKKGTPMVQDVVAFYFDEKVMTDTAQTFSMPGAPNGSRIAKFWIDGLARRQFFAAKAKVGVVRLEDDAMQRVVEEVVKPELAARKITFGGEAVLTKPEDISAGVLRFRSNGVTHVLIIDDSGLVAFAWMQQAESQGYRPRYGLTSADAPSAFLINNVPHAQLRGSIGVGWV